MRAAGERPQPPGRRGRKPAFSRLQVPRGPAGVSHHSLSKQVAEGVVIGGRRRLLRTRTIGTKRNRPRRPPADHLGGPRRAHASRQRRRTFIGANGSTPPCDEPPVVLAAGGPPAGGGPPTPGLQHAAPMRRRAKRRPSSRSRPPSRNADRGPRRLRPIGQCRRLPRAPWRQSKQSSKSFRAAAMDMNSALPH
jgi:hypothetical protein